MSLVMYLVLKYQVALPKKVVILAKHLVTTVACMTILTLQMIAVLENIHAVGAEPDTWVNLTSLPQNT